MSESSIFRTKEMDELILTHMDRSLEDFGALVRIEWALCKKQQIAELKEVLEKARVP